MVRMLKRNIFNELTGLRAIAAYLVFFHHFNCFTSNRTGTFLHLLVNEFHIGVTIFFVLSGFLIYYRYEGKVQIVSRKWLFDYFKNRIARIYPMFFFVVTLTFVIGFFIKNTGHYNWKIYVLNLSLVNGFFESSNYYLLPQSWTLTVEECFYLLAPLFIIFSKKHNLILPFLVLFFSGFGLIFLIWLNSNCMFICTGGNSSAG